jgi:aconitate hydratase 2/2-methylisocitrate dehydratase
MNSEVIAAYLKHEKERKELGIPPLPLNTVQTAEVCKLLENPGDQEEFLLDLFKNRIAPGVDPSAEIKADFLNKILKNEVTCR